MRKHASEKPYKCEFGDYCSAGKSNPQKHIRIDTGEKLFKCKWFNNLW